MIKLVIFDLDGTLINSLGDIANAGNHILSQYGLPIHREEAYKKFVGNGVDNLIKRSIPENYRTESFIKQLTNEFSAYYSQHSDILTQPYSGIRELLYWLQENSIKLAVASNKYDEDTKALVKQYFPEIRFNAVYGRRKGVPIKPNPIVIFDIMKDLNIDNRAQILYIGDSDVDMKTANEAGIYAVGVEWGFRSAEELLKSGADTIIKSPIDLQGIINDRNAKTS